MATLTLTEENFDATIANNDTVFIDFWAPWCAPCRAFAPIFEKVAAAHPEVVFAKLNTEEQQGIAAALQIQSIPTLMIFRQQVLLFAQPGMLPAPALEELVGKAAALDMEQVHKTIAEQREAQNEAA
ncbi:MAG: thioredoxin [Deltaproteobacteria bacterium]|nr:thioredoxin [Deltaproteobacteria bacterium]